MTLRPPDREVLERVRRIETRLTQTMIALGVKTQSQQPLFLWPEAGEESAVLRVSSPHTSILELMKSVPDNYRGKIRVLVGGTCFMVVDRGQQV